MPFEFLQIRNTTVKADTLRLQQVKKSEKASPILNDLDYYSRPYTVKDPFPDSHFVSVDYELELKKLRCFDSSQERERVEAKLRTFEADPCLLLLMKMLYLKADLNSLGFSSIGNTKQNRIQAFERLLRLKEHSLRFFVPVAVGVQEDPVVGVGYISKDKDLNIYLDALHVNLGSGENYRHLQHGSEALKASSVL